MRVSPFETIAIFQPIITILYTPLTRKRRFRKLMYNIRRHEKGYQIFGAKLKASTRFGRCTLRIDFLTPTNHRPGLVENVWMS